MRFEDVYFDKLQGPVICFFKLNNDHDYTFNTVSFVVYSTGPRWGMSIRLYITWRIVLSFLQWTSVVMVRCNGRWL